MRISGCGSTFLQTSTTAVTGMFMLLTSPGISAITGYTDVTAGSGISYFQNVTNPPAPAGWPMAGGAAAGDYDNDGYVDLFVTRMDAADILYRNQGDGTFVDVSAAAFPGVVPAPVNDQSNGAAWGDIDNDGDLDLYVMKWDSPRYYLYINNGNGTFTESAQARDAAVELGVNVNGTSVTFGDYDSDGNLDLFTGEWRNTTVAPIGARLLHNLGNGFFEDKTTAAGVDVLAATGQVRVFSPRFSDLDNDGKPDLAMSADFGNSKLYWNQGSGVFLDGTVAPLGSDQNGMGGSIGDFDGDGDQDWFVTAIAGNQGNWLYRNNGDRSFTDVTDTGIVSVRDGGWGWGASFLDYDNDGNLDLTMTNGFIGMNYGDYTADQIRMWRNQGGQYVEEVATALGLTDTQQGRGLVVLDFDNDGDQDIFIVNNKNGTSVLYRNDGGNSNKWLQIKVNGVDSNRDGIGARIRVIPDLALYDDTNPLPGTFQDQEVQAGSNYLSQNEMLPHFGLGDGDTVVDRVRITWPSGQVDTFDNIPTNRRYLATEYGTELATLVDPVPVIESPLPGATLSFGPATFDMRTNGMAVSLWSFRVGSFPGGNDIFTSGRIEGDILSVTIPAKKLPADGSTLHARLRIIKEEGGILDTFFEYAAVSAASIPKLTEPVPGTVLPSSDVTFSWSANGVAADAWSLKVGSSPGARDYLASGRLEAGTTSIDVSDLPADGSTVHVRLRYLNGGSLYQDDYQYTAAPGP